MAYCVSAVISGAAGTYVLTLMRDADVGTDLTIRLGQSAIGERRRGIGGCAGLVWGTPEAAAAWRSSSGRWRSAACGSTWTGALSVVGGASLALDSCILVVAAHGGGGITLPDGSYHETLCPAGRAGRARRGRAGPHLTDSWTQT